MKRDYYHDSCSKQGLNRYSYVLNNPYKYVDPTGNFVCGGLCVATAVIVGGSAFLGGLNEGGAALVQYSQGKITVTRVITRTISGGLGGATTGVFIIGGILINKNPTLATTGGVAAGSQVVRVSNNLFEGRGPFEGVTVENVVGDSIKHIGEDYTGAIIPPNNEKDSLIENINSNQQNDDSYYKQIKSDNIDYNNQQILNGFQNLNLNRMGSYIDYDSLINNYIEQRDYQAAENAYIESQQ